MIHVFGRHASTVASIHKPSSRPTLSQRFSPKLRQEMQRLEGIGLGLNLLCFHFGPF